MCKIGLNALYLHPECGCPKASLAVAKVSICLNFKEEEIQESPVCLQGMIPANQPCICKDEQSPSGLGAGTLEAGQSGSHLSFIHSSTGEAYAGGSQLKASLG